MTFPLKSFTVQFTNGVERRSATVLQPDIVFAAMQAQRWAPGIFRQRWNQIADRSKWKIVVISKDGKRHEEPAR
jgi:hypothetical protein